MLSSTPLIEHIQTEAIDIKVDLEIKETMLLTQGEIIETDSTVEKE